jgi:DegV family protein with EDD domain
MATHVVTDSTSYLSQEARDEFGITVVSLAVNFSDGAYFEEDIDTGWFFEKMKSTGEVPTSSLPAVSSIVDAFEAPVANGDEVVAVLLSSAMSGTYQTAMIARDMVIESHPNARIEIIDSRSNCMELGMAVLAAARVARDGGSARDAALAAEETVLRTRFLFVPHDLEYLKKGGRIGGASALAGALLQIRPILTVAHGETDVFSKVRTKKRAMGEIVKAFQADIAEKGFVDAVVHHIDDEDEGRLMVDLVEPVIGRRVPLVSIGPVIGLHVGPGTVGLVYQTEKEMCK